MAKIIPAILTNDQNDLEDKARKLSEFSQTIQIDFIDSKFCPNETVRPQACQNIGSVVLEAHLMVEDPLSWIKELPANFNFATIHLELSKIESTWKECSRYCSLHNIGLGLAVNPKTQLEKIKTLDPLPSQILIMGVNPGFSGQTLLESTYDKIAQAKTMFQTQISVDGGVNLENIPLLISSGVDILYIGAGILKNPNPKQLWAQFQQLIKS